MPTYIAQGRYAREGIKIMIVRPEDRAGEVARLAAESGGGVTDMKTTLALTSIEAKGAVAASDLASSFKSAGVA